MSSSGKLLQMDTPGTRRAKELFDLYQLLDNDDDVEGEDRLPALHAVAEMVICARHHFHLCLVVMARVH